MENKFLKDLGLPELKLKPAVTACNFIESNYFKNSSYYVDIDIVRLKLVNGKSRDTWFLIRIIEEREITFSNYALIEHLSITAEKQDE